MYKESKEDKIVGFLDTVINGECTKCGKVESFHLIDIYVAAELMAKAGWHPTEKSLYCPTCQKKRLNIKKK